MIDDGQHLAAADTGVDNDNNGDSVDDENSKKVHSRQEKKKFFRIVHNGKID